MNNVLHLIRWDIRRFRALLGAWLLLLAINAVLDATWPGFAADLATRQLVGTTANLLSLAEVLLSIVLIVQVVHAHPLVGTTAFWMTRPIPPRALLHAKLALFGVAMIAAPVIADAVLMTVYDVPWIDIARVSAQTALLWTVWIAIIMAAATLTPNLAKFALLMGGALLAFAVVMAIVAALVFYRWEALPPFSSGAEVPLPNSGLLGLILMVTAAPVFLLVQYRTRRRLVSSAVGVAGIVVAHFIGSAWPWPVFAPVVTTPAWAANPAMLDLTASADSVAVERSQSFRARPLDWRQARADLRMRGLEPGWTASVRVHRATVQVAGKPELVSNLRGHAASVPVETHGESPQEGEVTRRLLDVNSIIDDRPQERGENTIVLFARGSDIDRLAPAQGTYNGRFDVALTRHVIEGILPIKPGATHQDGAYRFSIAAMQLQSGRLWLLSEQSNAVSAFTRRPRARRSMYLRNKRASEAILGSSYDLRTEVTLMRFLPLATGLATESGEGDQSGFRARAEALEFPPSYLRKDLAVTLNDAWIGEAELVIVRSTEEGGVERPLAIADFPIRE
jgi:hypothetical protein